MIGRKRLVLSSLFLPLLTGGVHADPQVMSLRELLEEARSVDIAEILANKYGPDNCSVLTVSSVKNGGETRHENILVYPFFGHWAPNILLIRRQAANIRERVFGVDGFTSRQWQDIERCAQKSDGMFYFTNEAIPIYRGYRGAVPFCVLGVPPYSFEIPDKFRLDNPPGYFQEGVSVELRSHYYYDLSMIVSEWGLDFPKMSICSN